MKLTGKVQELKFIILWPRNNKTKDSWNYNSRVRIGIKWWWTIYYFSGYTSLAFWTLPSVLMLAMKDFYNKFLLTLRINICFYTCFTAEKETIDNRKSISYHFLSVQPVHAHSVMRSNMMKNLRGQKRSYFTG